MSKKIIVLTGSPRKNGNSSAMAAAFVEAAKAKGHEVIRFDTAMMKVGGCHACETCFQTGKACSFDDDFNLMATAIQEADAVVFSMPVYWYTMPAQIKAVFDKMFSFMVAQKLISGKESALLACCEEEDMGTFDGIKFPYEKSLALLKWNIVGEVLVPGVYEIGDIEKTDGTARAAALADLF